VKAAFVALVAGVVIYAFTRDGLVLHAVVGDGTWAAPDVIRYQLPDALWQFAFCVAVFAIWRDARVMLLPLALGLAAEATIGTFDPLDVLALCLGAATARIYAARSQLRERIA
jgi:hypothetical protein